jgi:predicted transport protein
MPEIDPQLQTMIDNMPEKTGKSLEDWYGVIQKAGLEKHGEIMNLLKDEHGVTHGFANTITLLYRQQAEGGPPAEEDMVAAQYAGPKAGLKPIYDDVIKTIESFGKDVQIAPKKAYVSLRRSKQFGLLQPSTKTRLDIGLNLKDVEPQGKLEASGSFNSMCTHRIRIEEPGDFDAEVKDWLKQAYEQA